MSVLVVIVSYKTVHLTIDCLHAISHEAQTIENLQVAICENGSGDDSAKQLQQLIDNRQWHNWCSLISIHPNLGFTGGNNAVIVPALKQNSPPDYVVLLNNDTLIKPGAIKQLIHFMDQHPQVGIAGSCLEDVDGTVQHSAFRFASILSELNDGMRLGLVSKLLKKFIVAQTIPIGQTRADWVSGACMMIRKTVLDAIGPLDTGYYTYFDDIDFCFNAKRAGYPTWYVPESHVVHLGGQTTGIDSKQTLGQRKPAYWYHARRRYWLKNHGPVIAALADIAMIAGLTLRRLRQLIDRSTDNDPANLLRDYIRHSVFLNGFAITQVQNPALLKTKSP